jgi:hypothetical protein
MSRTANRRPQAGLVSESLETVVVVHLDTGEAVRARVRLRRRPLRPGDRVIVDGGSVTPLFTGLRGSVQEIDARAVTIAGRRIAIDEHSVVRAGRTVRPAALSGLRPGTYVGALCVENRIEQTLTVQALFVGG